MVTSVQTRTAFPSRPFLRISCIGVLAVVLVSCNSTSSTAPIDASSQDKDSGAALEDKQDQGTPKLEEALESKPVVDKAAAPSIEEAALASPSALPKDGVDEETLDSELNAVRDEALESAIADGNITPLTSSCRMGQCVESYYTFTTLVREVEGEQLYSTELITFQGDMEGSEPGRWAFQPAETLVLCSTQRPLVIYQDSEGYILDHINPGAYPPGFAFESHGLYWAICHNVDNVFALTEDAMAGQASELGYGPDLEAEQTRSSFLELFEG